MQQNKQVITKQVEIIKSTLEPFVSKIDDYALIDFPDHSNVGDSAIWLGEVKVLKELYGKNPVYVSTINSFDKNKLTSKLTHGIIYIHGGGNFGDVWRSHQDFREMVIKSFPNVTIIQLPQSIKFYNENYLKQSIKNINAHNNFHLLVRDQQSYQLASSKFDCNVKLCPDSAFCIGSLNELGNQKYETVMLMRTDSERNEGVQFNDLNIDDKKNFVCDWLDESKLFKYQTFFLALYYYIFINYMSAIKLSYYNAKAQLRLNRGVKDLSKGKIVVTDRLHAHIISVLLNKANYVLDNNYGKVSGYIQQWTSEYPKTKVLKSTKEIISLLSN